MSTNNGLPLSHIPVCRKLCLPPRTSDYIILCECQWYYQSSHVLTAAIHLMSITGSHLMPTLMWQIAISSSGEICFSCAALHFHLRCLQSYFFPSIPRGSTLLLKPSYAGIWPLLQYYPAPNRVPIMYRISDENSISTLPSLSTRNELDFHSTGLSKCVGECYNAGSRLATMHWGQHDDFLVAQSLWDNWNSWERLFSSPFMHLIW